MERASIYYLAHTPYHIMLSIMHGGMRPGSKIILLDMQGSLKWYGTPEAYKFFGKQLNYYDFCENNIVKKLINKNRILGNLTNSSTSVISEQLKLAERVYVFNDAFPETQCIIRSTPAIIEYIEDGSAPYNSHRVTHPTGRWAQKILFGPKYERLSVLGTHSKIIRSNFSYPSLARGENRIKPIKGIPLVSSHLEYLRKLAQHMNRQEQTIPHKQSVVYLFPPHCSDNLSAAYTRLMNADRENNKQVLIKPHPVFAKPYSSANGDIVISSFVPIELLLFCSEHIERCIGYPSTALMSLKLLHPALRTECLIEGTSPQDDFFIENLTKIGVPIRRI